MVSHHINRTICWVNADVSCDVLLAVAHPTMAKTSKGWFVNIVKLILVTACKVAKPYTFDAMAFIRFYL